MIVLLNPPFKDKRIAYFQEFEAHTYANPALSILSGILYDKGIPYIVIDAKLDNMSVEQMLECMEEKLAGKKPSLIGVTNSTTTVIQDDMATMQRTKELYPDCPIVVGGPHVSALPERTLEECDAIDLACIFEGNETLLDLHDHYTNGRDPIELERIKGICYRDRNNKIVRTATRPKSKTSWQDFTRPRWEDFSVPDTYFVFTAIGCPFRCSYCYNTTNFHYSIRNTESVLDEIRYLVRERGVRQFFFADATFAANRKATMELLQRMVDEGFGEIVKWDCWTHVNALDEELLSLMKKAGCQWLALGIESGVDKVLERANKKTTAEKIISAIQLTKKVGLRCKAFLVFGHIGETIEDIEQTIKLTAQLNPYEVGVGIMVPWPGTEVFNLASNKQEGFELTTDDFSKYDKFFGDAMINKHIPSKTLEYLRVKCYLMVYLRNHRFIDMISFLWSMRRPITRKLISILKPRGWKNESKA